MTLNQTTNASIEGGGVDLLAVVCDAVRAADVRSDLDETIQRSLRGVGEAAGLGYVGVALLDGTSAQFDYRYEWCPDPAAEAVDAARKSVQRYVKESMTRLQRLEIVDRRVVLIVPLASHGAFAGFAVAARRATRAPWTEVEKNTLSLAAAVLMMKLEIHAAERGVRTRDRKLRLLLSATNDAVYEWPVGAREVLWNDAVLLLTDETTATFDNARGAWMERIAADDRARVASHLDEVMNGTGTLWSDEYRLRRRDGSTIWIADRAFVHRDPSGKAAKLVGAVMDVTERRRAEEARAASEERYYRLVESTYEGIVAVDRAGLCVLANASACRILGCQPADLIGRSFHDVVHPRHACEQWSHAKTLCPLGSLLEMQLAMPLAEELFARLDGTTIPVQFAGSAVTSAAMPGAVITFSDVTERKVLETELARANRMAGLGHVAATIAHEFNNVLMGIQPFLDLLLRRASGRPDMAEPLSRIGHSVQRGKRIAMEILRFSRPLHAVLAPLSLQQWLGEIAAEASGLLGIDHAVTLDTPPEPLFVSADRGLLHQAFLNLISNARDAMPSGGVFRIAVQHGTPQSRFGGNLMAPGRFVGISVSDSGHGMSEETLTHIFEPLFTTKKGGGSGLGLAVVHQIVTAHGGYIFAESQPGVGSTFTMFLCLAEGPAATTASAPAPQPGLEGCRVLLVEDDESVAAGTTAMLETEGIEAEVVTSGGAAVAAAERFRPTVVVLDVGLPDVDGREVFIALRARWPELPVIFSTGHAETRDVGGTARRVRVLQKPYEIGDLLRCIAAVSKDDQEEIR